MLRDLLTWRRAAPVTIAELLAAPVDGRYPVVEASSQQKRAMTLTALLNQLEGIAAQSPVLMVFEDVHWIDPTSLDLLDRTVVHIICASVSLGQYLHRQLIHLFTCRVALDFNVPTVDVASFVQTSS